jgi:two-component system, NtrC family, nitrogen regulation sensor histidine kinase NtrY
MNKQAGDIKNRAWGYLITGIVFLLSGYLLQEYFVKKAEPEKIRKRFFSVLNEKEKFAKSQLKNLSSTPGLLPDSVKLRQSYEYQKIFDLKKIAFFQYDDDSILFWSTNSFPLPFDFLKKQSASQEFVKLPNGWFEVIREPGLSGFSVALILLQHHYPFENDFLKNDFVPDYGVPPGSHLELPSNTGIHEGKNHNQSLALILPDKIPISEKNVLFLFILYLAGFFLVITSIHFFYRMLARFRLNKWLLFTGFTADVIILRLLIGYFHVPSLIFDSPLFGPTYYSSSFLLPSLGDFFLNSILLLIISYVFFLNFDRSLSLKKTVFQAFAVNVIIFIPVLSGSLFLCIASTRELVMNSSLPLTLQNISGLTIYSIIAFISLAAIYISCLLVILRLAGLFTVRNFGLALLLMAVLETMMLNHYNDIAEKEKRNLLAVRLGIERDPIAEMLFAKHEDDLMNDPFLSHGEQSEDSIANYLRRKYFGESWNNYIVQVTVCTPRKTLNIQPQNYLVDCHSYFRDLIQDFGKPVSGNHFYFLDYGYGLRNYLAIVPVGPIKKPDSVSSVAYIEINSKLLFKDLGYPELLIDKSKANFPDISGYSYAFYRNGKLIRSFGNADYSLDLDHALDHLPGTVHFYIRNGLDNYCYPINKSNLLIITRRDATFLDRIAPFSYLFFLLSIFSLLFFIVVRFRAMFRPSVIRFSERLQLTMAGIMISSLVIIGILSIYYITRLNYNKNQENLNERAHSILVELQHKLGTADNLRTRGPDFLNELMTKFSNVFFSDVNLYSPEGRLIATSRTEIFENGLVSPLMDRPAFCNLKYAHCSLYTHEEYIGTHNYSSAYLPFFNDRNQLLAYLNLPYFARQDDLKKEISTFMMAFINIYALLIIFGFFIAIFISNYITRPLRLLTIRLGNLTLGNTNEKLVWQRKDEVGKLVEEYNRKVDELAKSAEALARSERESAWKEMARQIAHEIKNPLTPMKLSVQYLQKAWDENSPDWDQRLRRFTATMTEQIDALSFIASEFSDFARMPDPKKEYIDLNEIVKNSIILYADISNIQFDFSSSSENSYAFADRKQLMRVFSNLINNSIQAIGEKKTGIIRIKLESANDKHFITISDNGTGIPEEQADRIFQPNFTTKSGGMGLGLAIVRNIILTTGGEISFRSEPGDGAAFTITLPAARFNKAIE